MCVYLEAAAPKAGNVTPAHAFSDMDFSDFLASGFPLKETFDQAERLTVGELVLQAVQATQERLAINTNLGTILLLAPLAKAVLNYRADSQNGSPFRVTAQDATVNVANLPSARVDGDGLGPWIGATLQGLTAQDAHAIYAAIRLARPGGLGSSHQHDVQGPSPDDLLEAMRLAAKTDAVARQYTNTFEDVCHQLLPWLRRGAGRGGSLADVVSEMQLRWLACEVDGLILRKCGPAVAIEAQQLANLALDEWLETGQRGVRWQALDTFLRSDGHARNPGTTADLIAAAIFLLLTVG